MGAGSVPAASFPIQLSNGRQPKTMGPCSLRRELDEAPVSLFQLSPTPGIWGSQTVDSLIYLLLIVKDRAHDAYTAI